MTWKGRTADERFDAFWTPEPNTGCHLWTGTISGHGYGRFHEGGGSRRMIRAHVYAWQREYGPVPVGLELDHFVCDTPPCCNPAHVRPETHQANSLRSNSFAAKNARKTHCPRGHGYVEGNIRRYQGRRYCVPCEKARSVSRIGQESPPCRISIPRE